MKLIPEKHMKSLPSLLVVVVLVLGIGLVEESRRHVRLQNECSAVSGKKVALLEKQKIAARSEKIFKERFARLAEYEKKIPQADGFVWISSILQEAAPDLTLNIEPPEMSGQKVLTPPEYCSGIFRVKSAGHMEDLIALLTKIESSAPFARVQELHVVFVRPEKNEIEFSFSLLVVMRLNEELEKPLQTASAGGGK